MAGVFETNKSLRGEDFDRVLKEVYANFVIAKVYGEVAKKFKGKCLACKGEGATYAIAAICANPKALPAGTLSWVCTTQNREYKFAGKRDAIVDRMIALWDQK